MHVFIFINKITQKEEVIRATNLASAKIELGRKVMNPEEWILNGASG